MGASGRDESDRQAADPIGHRAMALSICCCLLALALVAGTSVHAQTPVRTETIRQPTKPPPEAAAPTQKTAQADKGVDAHLAPLAAVPEIITDLSRLPPAVAHTREQILAAARTGDLQKLQDLMQAGPIMPVFAFTDEKDPIAFWKASYPDSDGIEVLSILVTILETGFVLLDAGTPQEIYVWPYFVRMSLPALTPQQKVELFRIVTGADYKDMADFGAYAFYRLGIGPDGVWHFFVAGD
jgi:hypothetical protein